jgi:hypothetical protein
MEAHDASEDDGAGDDALVVDDVVLTGELALHVDGGLGDAGRGDELGRERREADDGHLIDIRGEGTAGVVGGLDHPVTDDVDDELARLLYVGQGVLVAAVAVLADAYAQGRWIVGDSVEITEWGQIPHTDG